MSDIRSSTGKVLIISPHEDSLNELKISLPGASSKFHTSKDATIDSISKIHKLILLDASIADCLEVIKSIQNKHSASKILLFSTDYDPDLYIKARKLGIQDFIELPHDKKRLEFLINNAWDEYAELKKLETIAYSIFIYELEEKSKLAQELLEERVPSGQLLTENEIQVLYTHSHHPPVNLDISKKDPLEQKIEIAKLFIQEQTDCNIEINGDTLRAFFPIHIRYSTEEKRKIREGIGEDNFKKLLESLPYILVVEDEKDRRDQLEKRLKRLTPNLFTAESAEEALELLPTLPTLDLKILDIELADNGLSGIELLPKINDVFPDSETIMQTAYTKEKYVSESFNNFVFDYYVKNKSRNISEMVGRALQKRYFKMVLPTIGKEILNRYLSESTKLDILSDIAKGRQKKGKYLQMKDFYLLFPDLRQSKIPDDEVIKDYILEDGVGWFICIVRESIKSNADWKELVNDWHNFVIKNFLEEQ